MLQAAHHDNALARAWVVRVLDQSVKSLFLGSISQARPASAKVGWPAPSATRPAATTVSVLYQRVPKLFADLALARGDGRYARIMRSLNGAQLLILDDWGLDPLDAGARRDLYEILEERYGRRSTLLTSQVPVDKWHEVIGEPDLSPTPSSTGSSTMPIASTSPATACAAPDRDHSPRIDPQPASRQKPTRQQDASRGRHHVGTASDMISE